MQVVNYCASGGSGGAGLRVVWLYRCLLGYDSFGHAWIVVVVLVIFCFDNSMKDLILSCV